MCMATTQHTSKRRIVFPDHEPVGALPPKIGLLFNGDDPVWWSEGSGTHDFDASDRIVIRFTDHRSGQVAALLPALEHRNAIHRIHIEAGSISTADLAAISDARIRHVRFGIARTGKTLERASIVFEDGNDLSTMKHIVQLESFGVPLTDAHLESLGSPNALQFVNLDGTNLSPNVLARFPHLRHVHVSGDSAFGADLGSLAELPYLETIGIRFGGLSSDQLGVFGDMSQLWMLDLAYNEELVPDLGAVANAKNLSYLDISGTAADNSTILSLPDALPLATLKMQSSRIASKELHRLGSLDLLTHLDVAGTLVSDDGLESIVSALPKLRYLDIRATMVTANGMHHLSRLPQLATLGITADLFTVEVAERLKAETNLAEVHTCPPYPGDDIDGVIETSRAMDLFGAWKTVGRPL